MTTLRDALLRFVTQLRQAGVRISVAETLDAMNAVSAAGIERTRMREALAAALIKDETDRPIFDQMFSTLFASGHERTDNEWNKPGSESSAVPGAGRMKSDSIRPSQGNKRPSPQSTEERTRPRDESKIPGSEKSQQLEDSESENQREDRKGEQPGEAAKRAADETAQGSEAGKRSRLRRVERTPFERYSDLEYEEARDALAPIARRFRVRLGRRLRMANRGRLDFRRTIRASIQRGGVLSDLRFRARRPRHVDLLILADISGSVRYSSALMLELIAGAHDFFRRVRSFVFVDHLAEAEFEQGHLVMTPPLDLYARSDFGRVLNELFGRRGELLSRATVLLIMGDGRNNRRPARADLLREIGRLCRAVFWLIPEERERWGSGDSAIFLYAREASALLPSRNLRELEEALLKVA